MDKNLHTKIDNVLKTEAEYVLKNEKDKYKALDKMVNIERLKKYIDNFDELIPILDKYFDEKREKEKWER